MNEQERERLKARFWEICPTQGDGFHSKSDAEREAILDEMKQIASQLTQDQDARLQAEED